MKTCIHITLIRSEAGLVAATNMDQPARGVALSEAESAALGMLNTARGCGLKVVYGHNPHAALVDDLLNPEAFAHAVTPEVRDRARLATGMAAVEVIPAHHE
jgi:hypothetical protein